MAECYIFSFSCYFPVMSSVIWVREYIYFFNISFSFINRISCSYRGCKLVCILTNLDRVVVINSYNIANIMMRFIEYNVPGCILCNNLRSYIYNISTIWTIHNPCIYSVVLFPYNTTIYCRITFSVPYYQIHLLVSINIPDFKWNSYGNRLISSRVWIKWMIG